MYLFAGAGNIFKMCAKQLVDYSIENLYFTNRTYDRTVELTKELSENHSFEKMTENSGKLEVVITLAAASKPYTEGEDY